MTFGPDERHGLEPMGGGVTAAPGFTAGGVTAGLKASGRPDLALLDAGQPVTAAVTTTTNRVKAAPCIVSERNAADGRIRAVVVNSGNANACTGPTGLHDAESMIEAVADTVDTSPTDVLVCSTGIIGVRLPMERIRRGIPEVAADRTSDGGGRAAAAILTTDRTRKEVAYRAADETGECIVGGMAKGAGMIEPSMATMLAFITTDAPLSPAVLRAEVRQAVRRSFNRISVDACGSTNDTVVVLANGTADTPPRLATFRRALEAVCADLARAIVADGEGTTKVAEVRVEGAAGEGEAEALARAVASSVLFRAALHGADPNWGRVLAALGSAPVAFDPADVSVRFGPTDRPDEAVTVCRRGVAAAFDLDQAAVALSKRDVTVTIAVGDGGGAASLLTADLTPEYVRFNAAYTT